MEAILEMAMVGSRARLAVLLSGRGSNFLALHRAINDRRLPADVVLVVSNQPEAVGLARARELGLETFGLAHRGLGRKAHEERVLEALEKARADWICLAGYMRLLSAGFVRRYPERILNIHPSLLPAFPGLDAQGQAWRHGVRVAGCTVHLVDEGLDSGPIVEQRAVSVEDDDDAEALSARILEQEHLAYPRALERLLTEPWAIEGRRVVFGGAGGRPAEAPVGGC